MDQSQAHKIYFTVCLYSFLLEPKKSGRGDTVVTSAYVFLLLFRFVFFHLLEDPAKPLLALALLGQPLQSNVDVDLVLGRDRVARHFTVGNLLQVHDLDDLVHSQCSGQVILVAQDQDGDIGQLWLVQQVPELCPCCIYLILVCCVNHKSVKFGEIEGEREGMTQTKVKSTQSGDWES